ncbi:MAG TPA: MlaD family protein [Candidatus Omnitrophota bacterium]|nr:MlaD family protein [Candidatus Omnitrophota bacterium]HPD84775.1 MlaD family protein [Candidatus Omnitrophota bacterium]HRZ03633.1 MlaD family protein [Candidatus Omnitrophota bacterium]
MSKESNLELKVGAFVLLGIIALAAFIFSISDFSFLEKGKRMKAVFGFANGVKRSAPVRLAGVDVGSVKDIKVFFDPQEQKTKVRIDLWLKDETQVPADSKVWINQLGLMGEKYIEIIPGKDQATLLSEGASLTGEDPISFEEISSMIGKLSIKLQDSVDGFNKVIQNPKNQQSVEELLESLKLITKNIQEGKGTVGKLLYDDSIFEDLESFTADLKANPWKLLYRPSRRELKDQ